MGSDDRSLTTTTLPGTPAAFMNGQGMAGAVDMARLRAYRKGRVVRGLAERGLAGIVLFNPVNIRYACDARNMQVYGLHNPCRYLFVGADGHASLFEFRNCEHLSAHLETIDAVRPARAWYHMASGSTSGHAVQIFAGEIAELVRLHGGGSLNLAYDRLDPMAFAALKGQGICAVDGLALMDFARMIKSPEEIACMQEAIAACEVGLHRMQAAHVPGITEQALWAVLAHANAELGGEWMETRLLSAGQRTNPWYNECGDHVIGDGELLSFDTDLVGRHGYSVDISRSWLTGRGAATDEQRHLYALAHGQVHHNLAELRPGRMFSDVARTSCKLPRRFVPRMNRAIAHGIGLCNEYPLIVNQEYAGGAYDGEILEGMVLCVESYVGEPGGACGVKLEEQVLVTARGAVALSGFPYEERLL